MKEQQPLFHWPLIIGLGLLGLIRPLIRIVTDQAGIEVHGLVIVGVTILVSIAWILIVGFSRVRSPLLTLVFAGIAYGRFSIVLSGILSPILGGALAGPLANPIAIAPVLILNALWGLVTGGAALLVQRLRNNRERSADTGASSSL